jgi:hypothetical protein
MAKEKTYVKVESSKPASNEVYWKDSHGKIIKIEQTGDPKKRAGCRRFFAVLCWVIAIAFEVIGILRLNGNINWFSNMEIVTFILICFWIDLVFVLIWSFLWKKANHIDPASEKNQLKFWLWNNLWSIMSVVAFLPIIIFLLSDKKLDKKSKQLLWGVWVAVLAIAFLWSYDWNPVSIEWLERAEQEVLQVSPDGKVYWAPHSKKYHVDPDCPAFSNSETVYEWTVADAYERNLTDPCRRCIPELTDEEYEALGHSHEWEEAEVEEEEGGNVISDLLWELVWE